MRKYSTLTTEDTVTIKQIDICVPHPIKSFLTKIDATNTI